MDDSNMDGTAELTKPNTAQIRKNEKSRIYQKTLIPIAEKLPTSNFPKNANHPYVYIYYIFGD